MKKALSIAAMVGLLVLGIAAVAPLAEAHRTHNDRRTASECRLLNDAAKRQECLSCVASPRSHYHPGAPAGTRCRPNDGKRF